MSVRYRDAKVSPETNCFEVCASPETDPGDGAESELSHPTQVSDGRQAKPCRLHPFRWVR
jgi:hypothetical protein